MPPCSCQTSSHHPSYITYSFDTTLTHPTLRTSGLPGMAENKIYTFDQLIRQRAVDTDQTPLLAYPKSRLGVTDYELITGKQLDRLVDGAAHALIQVGIVPVVSYIFLGRESH